MSSKRKLLRKIKAGLIEVPEGWEQLIESMDSDTVPQPASTTVTAQEGPIVITETTIAPEVPAVEKVPLEAIEEPAMPTSTAGREAARPPARRAATKTRKAKTASKQAATKRKMRSKAKKE